MKMMPISELKPFEANPRKISPSEMEKLKQSIREFGMVQPIIINTNPERKNIIISGHQRVEAALSLGFHDVPVVEVDLDSHKEKLLNLAMNRIHGEFEEKKLQDILLNLEKENAEVLLSGFDENEIDKLLRNLRQEEINEDSIPEDVPATAKKGDIWQLGKHRLMCGDSTSKEDLEKLMNGNKADMVFTDPPYGVGYEQGKFTGIEVKKRFQPIENDELRGTDLKDFIKNVFSLVYNFCNESAPIYVFSPSMTESSRILEGCIEAGFHMQSQLVWFKNQFILGRADYHWQHESIWYGYKGKDHYWCGNRSQGTVWQIEKNPHLNYKHPTQKPVTLSVRAIKNSSKPKEIILDVFGGSGSTIIGCQQTDRICYMMELDEKYCDVIIKRWELYTDLQAKLIFRDGQSITL